MRNSFKSMTLTELKAKRVDIYKKYMELRFQLVIGHVENPLEKRTLRRQIARLNTRVSEQKRAVVMSILREKEDTEGLRG